MKLLIWRRSHFSFDRGAIVIVARDRGLRARLERGRAGVSTSRGLTT